MLKLPFSVVISLLPDEGPSLRVKTLFSKTFAGVSDSRVNNNNNNNKNTLVATHYTAAYNTTQFGWHD